MDNAHTIEKIQKLAEKRKSDKVIKFLDSSETEVVLAALKALSQIGDEDSVNRIASLIDCDDPQIRAAAAESLGSIGTEYAKTYLQHRMAEEKDEKVKTAIRDALHAIASNK